VLRQTVARPSQPFEMLMPKAKNSKNERKKTRKYAAVAPLIPHPQGQGKCFAPLRSGGGG